MLVSLLGALFNIEDDQFWHCIPYQQDISLGLSHRLDGVSTALCFYVILEMPPNYNHLSQYFSLSYFHLVFPFPRPTHYQFT